MDTVSNPPSSRRSTAPVVASAVGVGLAIGGALAFGSQNLVMGATIGGILALLFGGFAVFVTRVPLARGGTHADAGTAVFGSGHSRGDSDAGGSDAGGSDGGGGGGGDAG